MIVHVAVEGVAILNPADLDRPTRTIGESVTQLVAEEAFFVPSAGFETGYLGWKAAFGSGKAGFWTASVAKVVLTVDDGLRSRHTQ